MRILLSPVVALPAVLFAFAVGRAAAQESRPASPPETRRQAPDDVARRRKADAAFKRAELARRLIRAESAWADAAEPARRAGIPLLNDAMFAFFAGTMSNAAAALDRATGTLRGETTPAAWDAASGIRLSTYLFDPATTAVEFQRVELYPCAAAEADRPITWHIASTAGQDAGLEQAIADLGPQPSVVGSPVVFRPAKTFRGSFIVGVTQGPVWVETLRPFAIVACTPGLAARLAALRTALAASALQATSNDVRATLRHRIAVLESLALGVAPEAPIDGGALLDATERLIEDALAGSPWRRLSGDVVVAADDKGRETPVRLYLPPDQRPDEALPLIVAVHGAGGSENMFFEAYDRGRLVRLAAERRYIVAAPLSSGVGPSSVERAVKLASAVRNVDPRRIALVGHSMGSGVVLAAGQKTPEAYATIAAISGNGRPPKALADVPLFLAGGAADPLARASKPSTESRPKHRTVVYPDVEHVMIMNACLDDVFRFVADAFAAR